MEFLVISGRVQSIDRFSHQSLVEIEQVLLILFARLPEAKCVAFTAALRSAIENHIKTPLSFVRLTPVTLQSLSSLSVVYMVIDAVKDICPIMAQLFSFAGFISRFYIFMCM